MRVEPSQMGSVPYKRDPRVFPHSFCCVRTQREDSCPWTRKGTLARRQPANAFILNFLAPRTVRKALLLFVSHPSYGILLEQPDRTETCPHLQGPEKQEDRLGPPREGSRSCAHFFKPWNKWPRSQPQLKREVARGCRPQKGIGVWEGVCLWQWGICTMGPSEEVKAQIQGLWFIETIQSRQWLKSAAGANSSATMKGVWDTRLG